MDLEVGDDSVVYAYLTPADAGNVSFTSSNSFVVTVDAKGNVKAVGAGKANIIVSFAGDDKYNAAQNKTLSVAVSLRDASVSVNNDTLDLLVDGTFTVVATTSPEGLNVTFTPDNSGVVSVDENGVVTALKEGKATVKVSVGGDGVYALNTTDVTVTVNKIPTKIIVNNDTLDMEVGDGASDVAVLEPITGDNLNYTSSNPKVVKVEDGKIVAVAEGTATVTVSYAGNDKYEAAEDKVIEVTVSLRDAIVSVNNVTLDLLIDDEFVIVATTSPEGLDVTFTPDNSGVVSVDENGVITALKEGKAAVKVSVGGDGVYALNTTTVTITVSKIPTEIIVNNATLDLFVDDIASDVASLKPNTAGNLSYTSSNPKVVRVEDGEIVAVGAGEAIVTVSYAGNDRYATAEDKTIDVSVSKIPTSISAIVDSELTVGDNSNVKYSLTPSDATGKVSFKSSNSKVLTVDAKGNVKAVGEGSATITVTYEGDNKYALSNTTVNVKVSKSEIEPEIKQNDTTLTITVPSDATGDVTVTIGNETIKAPIKDGKVVIDLSDVPAGDYNATVSYPGDSKYSGFNVIAPVSIQSKFQLIAENLTKYYHGAERFAVKLVNGKGNPISGAELKILVNSIIYTRITDENGSASIGVNLESGEYITTVTCNNTTVETTITVLTTVNGTDLVKVFRNATQYYATFRDSEGNYLKDGTTVRFNIYGVFYDRTISGDKGLAKLNINLEQGEYIITAINLVTGESRANNITVMPRIIENYDLTKYYRNASQYTVKLIGDDGKAVEAGENVTFNINGVFYTRTTNASGIAKLNINLQPGDYVIIVGYKGCMVSNNIKVLPVLAAKDLTKKYGTSDQFVATLVDGQGKAYSGQTVQFNVYGIFYNRVTDSNGQAKLNIRLMPGKYIITSSYNGASIANNITVSA